jgi:hypothetical protein
MSRVIEFDTEYTCPGCEEPGTVHVRRIWTHQGVKHQVGATSCSNGCRPERRALYLAAGFCPESNCTRELEDGVVLGELRVWCPVHGEIPEVGAA